jgi:hypothetical protein
MMRLMSNWVQLPAHAKLLWFDKANPIGATKYRRIQPGEHVYLPRHPGRCPGQVAMCTQATPRQRPAGGSQL